MAMGRQLRRSDLFLVRFWEGEDGESAAEWHGKVQRTVTGEARYFHDWSELVNVLSVMLSANGRETAQPGEEESRSSG